MDTGTFKSPVLRAPLPELTFVLTQLDVYNWGAFSGRHTAHFDLEGTAIIGPTGSGKTTLVDALMTLITAVVLAMIIMFFFSQKIADFINRRPTLKVLALSFLLMVGFSLFFEGLEPVHHTHIDKGYIYFSMAFAFGVELLNTRLKKGKK